MAIAIIAIFPFSPKSNIQLDEIAMSYRVVYKNIADFIVIESHISSITTMESD